MSKSPGFKILNNKDNAIKLKNNFTNFKIFLFDVCLSTINKSMTVVKNKLAKNAKILKR
nr:hypothetical protein [Clostridioides sp.]